MECPKCGAALPVAEQDCAQCAAGVSRSDASPQPASEPPDPSVPRPFAHITPYSGPYPPAYVQVSSSESRPGPINILAKTVGPLWSVVVVLCFLVNANSSKLEHWNALDTLNGGGVTPFFWIGLWAVVAIPAFFIYRATRPKSLKEQRAFAPRGKKNP